jgi:flagellar hook assembly protein FlgD
MADETYRLRGTNSIGPSVSIDFVTDNGTSDANAKVVGQSFATLLGCNVDVYDGDGVLVDQYTPGDQSAGTVDSADGVVVSSAI